MLRLHHTKVHKGETIEESRFFLENAVEPGFDSDFALGDYGRLSGRVSGIFDMTSGGLNAAATNYGDIQARDFSIEDSYFRWSSGTLFPRLREDAIRLIGGRYTYQIGDGFLFYNGAKGGGNKVAACPVPHHAFRAERDRQLELSWCAPGGILPEPQNDHSSTNTELAGVNGAMRMFEAIQMGLTYANIFHSETAPRQGLTLIYWRIEGAVLPTIKDFYLASSFVAEGNGDRVSGAYSWYITPSYT